MLIRNASYPEVLEFCVADVYEAWAELRPATQDVQLAMDRLQAVEAKIAASLVVVYHEAKRTHTWGMLYDNFKTAKGSSDTVKFIYHLMDGRVVNDRMAQAVTEMGSVIAVFASRYSLIDQPTRDEVLAEINKLGTVSTIHDQYLADERKRVAAEQEALDRKARAAKEALASAHGMTYEEYVAFERKQKQDEQHERNKENRERLLKKLLAECKALDTAQDAPDGAVLLKHQGKLLVFSREFSLTVLDAVS